MEMIMVKDEQNDDNQGMQQNDQSINDATTVKRSSRFRRVSRHRWTGKYEAHLWDKLSWNVTQKKKGRQGAYDEEEVAARAYDLAALKYWGTSTSTNFPIEIMQTVTKEEFLASLRRKRSGFSRGVSKWELQSTFLDNLVTYAPIYLEDHILVRLRHMYCKLKIPLDKTCRHYYHNGRWEARIGRVFGNKYLNLGSYNTQEEAARAYDIAAIKCRGINAVTNFDLSTYAGWLRPELTNNTETESVQSTSCYSLIEQSKPSIHYPFAVDHFNSPQKQEHVETKLPVNVKSNKSSSPTALSLLLRSSVFQELVEKNANNRK
ncbi:hypothetical protein CXB51_024069 [Gossypium anomalum]|uniref:AP2/ERF domain-containing protein n=1 Tax=Gossypium anomalum TaxID=47600 RepID=A0A8J5YJ12_9ROSI|nr:hypothetical protein CXB51_024069 [Gossypium anomalum]